MHFFVAWRHAISSLKGPQSQAYTNGTTGVTGDIVEESPVKTGRPGSYKAKIVPLSGLMEKVQRIDLRRK